MRRKIGQLLCERSYLDQGGLDTALAEQKVEHRWLGQILLDLGHITQAQLEEGLALQVGIEKIELGVFESNTTAIHLYDTFGFQREGIKIRARKLDGRYDNMVLMAKFLNG